MKQDIQSHQFTDSMGNPAGGHTFAPGLCIAWQNGPLGRGPGRAEPNGCFVETVIDAAADRLKFYERSRFQCKENAEALHHLEQALSWLNQRTARREAANVEGTHAGN
jgi:hypothetical protein